MHDRIKSSLSKLISNYQPDFVEETSIIEDTLLTQEIVNHTKTKQRSQEMWLLNQKWSKLIIEYLGSS